MTIRSILLGTGAVAALCCAQAGTAQSAPQNIAAIADDTSTGGLAAPGDETDPDADGEIIVRGAATRSVTQLSGAEIQKVLPGISPLKAIQTLPGVTFLTADPWGNNEQNISLFVHGFNAQQLGYTLDGVPLGDQQYGNYNGLSPQRAIISEDVGRVVLSSGAGDLGTASTSNLGGTIDTFSSDPRPTFGISAEQVVGSYQATRSYLRLDSGDLGDGTRLFVSGLRQRARAWDFEGYQKGWQGNAKLVREDGTGRLTAYFAYSDKAEPNEDATVVSTTQTYQPYIRPFLYPNFSQARAYYANQRPYNGAPTYAAAGANYSNYYSDAQRTDYLGYVKYDWNVATGLTWSNQAYFHHNDGVGVVAGPITVAGLPLLFSFYYPGATGSSPTSTVNLARLSTIFGGSGLATRTTEYRIDRVGGISTLRLELGDHKIELGGWYEHQSSSAYRRWYALDVNAPSSPYTRPGDLADPLITQYGSEIRVDEIQAHIQDAWRIVPRFTIQAGFKSTFQRASQQVPVQPIPGSFTGSRELPVGRLNTSKWFLPQAGALWDVTDHEQVFVNAQRNIRQFQTSAAAGLSPFALGSQTLFDFFRTNTKPETSLTYEGGIRTRRTLALGPLTGFDGQISYYHVDFSNRLLAISPTTTITAIVSGAPIIANVGSVTTDGIDVAGTFRFGELFSLYDAVSYNNSRYDDNYTVGAAQTVVPTAGRKVPGSPDWLNKTVATLHGEGVELQVIGDYIGRRYATYTNDLKVDGYFTLSGRLGFDMPVGEAGIAKKLSVSLNVTNITNKKAASTISVGAASGTYNFFPLAPRQVFATISAGF
ncbi:TonB-dependent receptor [Sphingomonas sp. Leaf339]|uniref:TonB-dependent receptor n=1 Tax=Sphingomonas sp. Leaf339 TaxID=1736343 RepID=UPI0006F76C38|nr:TonB-dependent receptor plug domain-containing protein [Sphingomonas sp. Leaf339]KQU56038.1 TonB-dependent receptor [Sphingomonas sp. Leaf339]